MPAHFKQPSDLGVGSDNKKVFLFFNLLGEKDDPFRVGVSEDGLNFRSYPKRPVIETNGKKQNTINCSDFRISKLRDGYFLTYKVRLKTRNNIVGAFSKNLIFYKKLGKISPLKEIAMLVPNYRYKGQYVLYFGEKEIKLAFSKDLKSWKIQEESVLKTRNDYFDNFPIAVGNLILTPKGIVLIYYVKVNKREGTEYLVGACLFDRKNPGQIKWRKNVPIFDSTNNWNGKSVYPIGALHFKDKLLLYFTVDDRVFVVSYSNFDEILNIEEPHVSLLDKHKGNPIIKPVLEHGWESQATFNAAAVYEDGKVHLVYRAIGENGRSVLGYAASTDGINIDERLNAPIYIPTQIFECPFGLPTFSFMSGGGYGGCEDPRITKIRDKFYMTYVAFNGWESPRIAITSIKVDDFLNKRWNWETAKLISQPHVVNKNPCLLPDKINGKYVMFHRVFPNILIDFVDDLNFNNTYLKGEFKITPRDKFWDSRKIGAGPPPIKTKDGWLLIYHAVDNRDSAKYKIGAMLLALNDPTQVLYRSNYPILEPIEQYENEGYKSGVCYPCGAVVVGPRLIVYYGGADTYVCAAEKNLDCFLYELKSSNQASLDPIPTTQRIFKYHD